MQESYKSFHSTEEKTRIVSSKLCKNCIILRSTDLDTLFTKGMELDVEVWPTAEIFKLSTNIHLCEMDSIFGDTFSKEDVKIRFQHPNDVEFVSDFQIDTIPENEIKTIVSEMAVFFVCSDLEGITGNYPIESKDHNDPKIKYRLVLRYDPRILNFRHCLIQVEADIDGEGKYRAITNDSNKNFNRTIAKKIRHKMISAGVVKDLRSFESFQAGTEF